MILGIDEAGRGPVLGPLVVAGLVSNDEAELERMGVRDSKMLSPVRRKRLYEILRGRGGHSILEVPARGIDEARRSMTMNRLEVIAFASILSSFLLGKETLHPDLPGGCLISIHPSRTMLDGVVMDAADTNELRFGRDVQRAQFELTGRVDVTITSKHKADRDRPVVGAASILAKVTRDLRVSEHEKSIGRPLGSGYPSDPVTRDFLSSWFDEFGHLPDFARRSWKTCSNMVSGQQKLSDL